VIVFGWKYLEPHEKEVYKPLLIFQNLKFVEFLNNKDVAKIHTRGLGIILTHLQEMNTISMKKIETTMSKTNMNLFYNWSLMNELQQGCKPHII